LTCPTGRPKGGARSGRFPDELLLEPAPARGLHGALELRERETPIPDLLTLLNQLHQNALRRSHEREANPWLTRDRLKCDFCPFRL
jgi:hypothetical protein